MKLLKKINFHWVATPVIILASAFVTNAVIMLLCHYNPLEAYQAAWWTFGNGRKLGKRSEKHAVSYDWTLGCNGVRCGNLEYRC